MPSGGGHTIKALFEPFRPATGETGGAGRALPGLPRPALRHVRRAKPRAAPFDVEAMRHRVMDAAAISAMWRRISPSPNGVGASAGMRSSGSGRPSVSAISRFP